MEILEMVGHRPVLLHKLPIFTRNCLKNDLIRTLMRYSYFQFTILMACDYKYIFYSLYEKPSCQQIHYYIFQKKIFQKQIHYYSCIWSSQLNMNYWHIDLSCGVLIPCWTPSNFTVWVAGLSYGHKDLLNKIHSSSTSTASG